MFLNSLLKVDQISYSPPELKIFNKDKTEKVILKKISFIIGEGKTLAIVGESGSGKTTLAKVLCGILQPTDGEIILSSGVENKNNRTNPIQILFQNTDELINPLRKVGDILKESFRQERRLKEICDLLDIPKEQFDKIGYQLSGGERQRVGLARVLSANPKILILDEPFSAQDPESQKKFLSLFQKIKSEYELTIICISHDIKMLKEFADEIIVLFGGKIMEKGKVETIFNNARHPYTKFLIDACDYNLTRSDIKGNTDLLNVVEECSYYSRCDKRSVKCIEVVDKIVTDDLQTFCNHPI